MRKQVRILIVEDNAADAELAQLELQRGNIAFTSSVVANQEDFVQGLQTFAPDLILSDCTLTDFDGLSALAIAREKCPGTPFIFFSGTLGKRGGESLKQGATAYILKDQRSQLAPAVKQALRNLKSRTQMTRKSAALRESGGRRQGDDELKKAVQLYRTVAENIPNGIVAIFDQDLRYIAVDGNQALEMVGFCKEGVEGKTIHELVPPGACLEIEPVYRAALAGTATMTEIPMFGHNNYLVHVLPLRDGKGEIYAGIALAIDITERRLVQDQVRRFNQELERRVAERTTQLESVNDELEAFCYTVSHDLRAPLRAMQGLAEATLEDCGDQLDSTGKAYARRIIAAANRMDTLIQGLLAYSRLSRADLELGPVSLDSVVKIALCQLEAEIKERAARITVEGSLPRVMGHQLTLVQIMSNLMSNGIKFVSRGVKPEMRIRAETRGDRVRLWVEDNGIGISPEHHARIFNVFERLHGVEAFPGTGIGLAIIRKGVERLGGRVGLESVPGKGSRFWIELSKEGKAR